MKASLGLDERVKKGFFIKNYLGEKWKSWWFNVLNYERNINREPPAFPAIHGGNSCPEGEIGRRRVELS